MQSSYVPEEVWEAEQAVVRTFPHSKRVGQYLLGRLIGEGSFAKVRESLHTTTAYKVAVKVINKKKARQDAYVKRNLRREARVMQQLRHANIIQLYEVIETDNSYYLVMELCRGGGLMEHICAKRRLSESESCRYMRQILSAVHYMHRAGVIHRDLKIENLLLDENRNIKIIDFGLSTIVRTEVEGRCEVEELCVTQCGSPAYAAPELLSSKKYGSKVDIWSIGVNMFAMLTGTLPFTVEPFHVKALYNKMVAGDMNPLPAYLSRESKDLIKKFLIAEPEWRISLTAAMEHPWITGGGVRRLEPAVFPNRLRSTDLDEVVVQRMSQHLNHRISDIIRCVINNTPSSVTATYHYLRYKLLRFKTERGLFQKISAEMSLPFIPSDSVDSTKVDLFQERRTRHDSDISEGEVVRSKPLNIAHLPQITAAYQKSVQAKIEAYGSDNGQKRVGDTNDTQTTAFISVVEDERMANENSSCDSGVTVDRVSHVHDTTIRHTRADDTGPSTGTGTTVGISDKTALKSDYTRATAASQYKRHTSEVAKHNSNTTQTAKGKNADAVKWQNANGAAVHSVTTQTLSDKAKAKSNGETGRQVTQMSTVRRLPYLPLSTVLSARQPANTVPVNSASNSKLTLRDVIQQGDDSHSLTRRHSRPHNHLPALANSPR